MRQDRASQLEPLDIPERPLLKGGLAPMRRPPSCIDGSGHDVHLSPR
jgi:hypothetical protein